MKKTPIETDIEFRLPGGLCIRGHAYGDEQARPVLLAHGGGQTRHSWGKTAELLAEQGWYAIAYDHRGHGESDWAPDSDYDLVRFAEDLSHLCHELDQAPVVVGASLGGLSAMLAAGEHRQEQELISALVLVDITPRMNISGAQNIIDFMSARVDEGFGSLDEAADIIAEYTKRPKRKNLDGLRKNLRECEDGRFRWHWDPAFTRQRISRQSQADYGLPDRMERAVANISVPMLLVRGARSDLVTEALAREFLRTVPHAEYVDVENAHHMVAGDRNDIFSAAVLEFMGRL